MKRREFFNTSLGAFLLSLFSQRLIAGNGDRKSSVRPMPKRLFKDDVELSVIGFGGIVVVGMDQSQANAIVRESFERGINYFDVAPSYGDGEAEQKLGPALEPFRKKSFLACKTLRRDAAGAAQELDTSLKRLKTDYFDLYQLHAVTRADDVEKIFAPNGAMETFLKARKAGKIKYIGFSAHSEKAALMLLERFEFDSVLFPVNFVNYAQGNFGPIVMKKAKEKGAARLALKAMAYSPWPQGMERDCKKCWYRPVDDREMAKQALSFTLSEDVTSAIPPGDENLFRMAMDLAPEIKQLTPLERNRILAQTEGVEPLFPLSG